MAAGWQSFKEAFFVSVVGGVNELNGDAEGFPVPVVSNLISIYSFCLTRSG